MLFRFSLYGFLKNQRYFEPFLMLAFIEQGLSFTAIGWLIACRAVTINLLEIPSGAIADAMGRRKVMLASFAAYLASFLTFAIASSVALFVPAMILFGIGDSFRTGTHKSMIFEWLRLQGRTEERTRIYGITRGWSKFGSAISGLLAAMFVILADSYRYVFLFSAIPCVLSMINLASYPRALDGEHLQDVDHSIDVKAAAIRARNTLAKVIRKPPLRGLMMETMGWEGVFHAAKDYLQPVLATLALAAVSDWFALSVGDALSETQQSALLIGPIYAVLFLLAGVASRFAFRIPERAGSMKRATSWLWAGNLILFAALIIAGWFDWLVIVALIFVLFHLGQSLWRPVMVSRFDDHAAAEEGATVLSIESQSQRLATMALAPILGWLVDTATEIEACGAYWPIGVVGLVASLLVIYQRRVAK